MVAVVQAPEAPPATAPDLAGTPTDELQELVEQTFALQMAALRQMLAGVAALVAHDLGRCDPVRSVADYLATRLGLPYGLAVRMVRTAVALEDRPHLAALLGSGSISYEVCEAAAEIATPETDAEVAERARGWSARQARYELRLHAMRQRAASGRPGTEPAPSVRLWWREESVLEGRFTFTGEDAALVAKRLDHEAVCQPPNPATGFYDPMDERRARGLVELCSVPSSRTVDAERATLIVHVNHDDLHDAGGGVATLDVGLVIGPEALRRLSCDATCQFVVHREGVPIGIGRQSEVVPRWLRRLVRRRDDYQCQFPRCASTKFLDAHHIVHWEFGGPTDIDNLVTLCSFHHKWLHRQRWSIRARAGGGFEVFDRDGRRYDRRGPAIYPAVRDRWFEPVPVAGARLS